MLTSEARIATPRAGRYLAQMCGHAGQMSRLGHRPLAHRGGGMPPAVRHAEVSGSDGLIDFGWGRCMLHATDDELVLRAEAPDEQGLARIQDGMTRRIETIGRRDRLTVTWHDTAPAQPPGEVRNEVQEPEAGPGRRRIRGGAIGLSAVIVVVVAMHLGLGGALATSPWTGWAEGAVLAIIVLKVVAVAAHLLVGRLAIRRRRRVAPLGPPRAGNQEE